MPGFNRRGPVGDGPMTGRGMGMCNRQGFTGRRGGRGMGRGLGNGGFGYRNFKADINPQAEVEELKLMLSDISKRLESIESAPSEKEK